MTTHDAGVRVSVPAEMVEEAERHREWLWGLWGGVTAYGPPEPVVVDVIPDQPPAEYDDEHRRLWWALHSIASEPDDGDVDGWAIDAATEAISTGREFRPGTVRPVYCPPRAKEHK